MEIIEGNYLSHEFLGRLERVGRSSEHLLRDYTNMVMYKKIRDTVVFASRLIIISLLSRLKKT